MKKALMAIALVLILAGSAAAKALTFSACTADGKPATLTAVINDNASIAVSQNVAQAFTNAAAALPAERLITFEGFKFFVAGLSDEAKQNVEIPEAPAIDVKGSCKVKK